jgi:hypothetical protein
MQTCRVEEGELVEEGESSRRGRDQSRKAGLVEVGEFSGGGRVAELGVEGLVEEPGPSRSPTRVQSKQASLSGESPVEARAGEGESVQVVESSRSRRFQWKQACSVKEGESTGPSRRVQVGES